MIARSRTSGGIKANPISGSYCTYTNGGACLTTPPSWTCTPTSYPDYIGTYRKMTDFVTPGFHKRRAQGEVFFNPMHSTVITFEAATGTSGHNRANTQSCVGYPYPHYSEWYFTNAHQVLFSNYYNSSSLFISGPLTGSERQNVEDEARTSCLANRGRGDSNLYESIAEAHRILGAFTTVFESMAQWLRSNRSIVTRAQDSANGYLAFRYGIQPFISDLESILHGAQQIRGLKRKTYRGSASLTGSSVNTSDYVSIASMQYVKHTITMTEIYTVRAMSLDEFYATLFDNLNLQIKGLIGLPWELMSYSFVIDWFTNVGDFIYSVIPSVGATQLGSCFVSESNLTLIDTAHSAIPVTGQSIVVPFSGTKKIVQVTKHRIPDIGAPALVIRNDFRFDTLRRAIDACALAVQLLR